MRPRFVAGWLLIGACLSAFVAHDEWLALALVVLSVVVWLVSAFTGTDYWLERRKLPRHSDLMENGGWK